VGLSAQSKDGFNKIKIPVRQPRSFDFMLHPEIPWLST
jgi:hypothetical protein